MEIINRKIDEIIPYENNPRNNDEAVDYVAKSIEEFGFKVPIILDKNNIIVTGHTRLKAAKKLGLKEVPTIMADDLTDEQIKAFRLADNKVSEYAEWDLDILNDELMNSFDTIDMSDFGFDLELDLDDDEAYSFEEKNEEWEKKDIDEQSILYIGAVSLFGESGDTICQYDINKELANKLLKVIKENGEEYINKTIVEALNDL